MVYSLKLCLCTQSWDVTYAECGCPAGTAPGGSCKHIAALCYALEEYGRISSIRSPTACTSQLQKWNHPRKRKLDPAPLATMKFVKEEYGKKKRENVMKQDDPRPSQLQCTTKEEIDTFTRKLKSTQKNIGFLHVIPDSAILSTPITTASNLPLIPKSYIARIHNEMRTSEQPLCVKTIHTFGERLLQQLTITENQIKAVERATVGQKIRKRWHEERHGRLTASNFGRIIKGRKYGNIAADLLYNSKSQLSSEAVRWGNDHEEEARQEYERTLSSGETVKECGIFISKEHGFLGGSPDGVVFDENNTSIGIVEIKCPFSIRQLESFEEACSRKAFFCETIDGTLKRSHDYYYQVQGQLAMTGLEWCDFVVWTPHTLHVERIFFDSVFWESKCLPFLSSFYSSVILPELVYPRHMLGLDVIDYRKL